MSLNTNLLPLPNPKSNKNKNVELSKAFRVV
jgi:hypothetical protein